jgi:hypothetical protein
MAILVQCDEGSHKRGDEMGGLEASLHYTQRIYGGEILIEADTEDTLVQKTPERRAEPELMWSDDLTLCRAHPSAPIRMMLTRPSPHRRSRSGQKPCHRFPGENGPGACLDCAAD